MDKPTPHETLELIATAYPTLGASLTDAIKEAEAAGLAFSEMRIDQGLVDLLFVTDPHDRFRGVRVSRIIGNRVFWLATLNGPWTNAEGETVTDALEALAIRLESIVPEPHAPASIAAEIRRRIRPPSQKGSTP